MNDFTEYAREARREYMREWRAKNGDKIRESNRRYWERRAAREKERDNHAETKDKP